VATLREAEAKTILEALLSTNGNHSRAAKILGITREGLRLKFNRHKKLGFKFPPFLKK
jgi:DNA-binding protein Fis